MVNTEVVEAPDVGDVTVEHLLLDGGNPPGKSKRRRRLVGSAVIVVAVAAGLGIWLGTSGGSSAAVTVSEESVAVTTGTIKQTVSTSGTIEPADEADLDFSVSGKITAVDVVAGQTVTVGQTLASVATTALQDDVNSAEASLTSAQVRLTDDQDDDASTSQIDSDEASVTSAQSQVTTATTDLTDANLTSTIAGTVASVSLTVGEQVTGSGSAGGGSGAGGSGSGSSSTTQAEVISTGDYKVSATVDDTVVKEIVVGDQVDITTTGSTTTHYGTVSSVGLIATGSSDVATFPVVIAVTGTAATLAAGSTATASIIVKQLTDIVEVPTAAITYSSSGKATVTLVEDGKHVIQSVTTGESQDGKTQITKGLKSGQKVLERVVTFSGGTGGSRTLLGGSGSTSTTQGAGPGGGTGGFPTGGGTPGGGGSRG